MGYRALPEIISSCFRVAPMPVSQLTAVSLAQRLKNRLRGIAFWVYASLTGYGQAGIASPEISGAVIAPCGNGAFFVSPVYGGLRRDSVRGAGSTIPVLQTRCSLPPSKQVMVAVNQTF